MKRFFFTMVTAAVVVALVCTLPLFGEEKTDPYAPLDFLIGTWELAMEGGVGPKPPPRMSFEWAPGRTHIRHTGLRPHEGGLVPEFEGIIVWHGVEKRLIFLNVYASSGERYFEDGWIEVLEGGAVRRHMRVHYDQGVGLPWSDGAVAGPDGHTLEFRQTWTPAGDGTMRGAFEMKRGDAWRTPDFGHPMPESGIRWRRIEGP